MIKTKHVRFLHIYCITESEEINMDINIHITADSALVNALSDIAGALAAVSIAQSGKDGHLPPKTVPEPPKEAPKADAKAAPKAEPKKEELKGETVSPAKAKEINDLMQTGNADEIIDPKTLLKVRALVGEYCKVVGREEGRENIKNWLNENNFAGLTKLTYKGKDTLVAFVEAEVKAKKEVA
jgi:hypothetical protein